MPHLNRVDPKPAPSIRPAWRFASVAPGRMGQTQHLEAIDMANSFCLGRRGSVAVWLVGMTAGLVMAMSLAVEVGSWAAAKVQVQRSADLSAIAGVINYQATGNNQTAATFIAHISHESGPTGPE